LTATEAGEYTVALVTPTNVLEVKDDNIVLIQESDLVSGMESYASTYTFTPDETRTYNFTLTAQNIDYIAVVDSDDFELYGFDSYEFQIRCTAGIAVNLKFISNYSGSINHLKVEAGAVGYPQLVVDATKLQWIYTPGNMTFEVAEGTVEGDYEIIITRTKLSGQSSFGATINDGEATWLETDTENAQLVRLVVKVKAGDLIVINTNALSNAGFYIQLATVTPTESSESDT
jgi:hypothetical protein